MTVQSNLLMSRLVQARISCSSYPEHQEKWTALTPALPSFTDHHEPSASSLHPTLLQPAFHPQFPSATASPPQQMLLLCPVLSQPRGSALHTQKCCIFTILQLPAKCPVRFACSSWAVEESREVLPAPSSCSSSLGLPGSPSPCFYLEFLPLLPLPLAASSCSLCALDSFVPPFRNTL